MNEQATITFSYPDDEVFDTSSAFLHVAQPARLRLAGDGHCSRCHRAGSGAQLLRTGGPGTNTGGNIGDDGVANPAPTANLTVAVNSCGFTVRAQADFSVPTAIPPTTASPPTIPSGQAVSVPLREQPLGHGCRGRRDHFARQHFVSFMELDSAGNPPPSCVPGTEQPEFLL